MSTSSVSSRTLSLHPESIDDIEDISLDGGIASTTDTVESPSQPGIMCCDRLTDESYLLPSIYTQPGCDTGYSPSMLAAQQPDSRILSKVLWSGHSLYCTSELPNLQRGPEKGKCLLHGSAVDKIEFEDSLYQTREEFSPDALRVVRDRNNDVGISTPLMEAIRAQIPENVEVLLNFGANPNAVPVELLEHYAGLFMRFRPALPPLDDGAWDVASREELLDCMGLPQLAPLTREEMEDRAWDGMAPFWCEEGFTPIDFYRHGESMPSLVEAARCGSIQIFDMLLKAGADASFWMRPRTQLQECRPGISSLSVSSPLHACNDEAMLQHLLELGFDPNIMPLANPTRCLTPLMVAVIQHDKFNKAFDILCSYPSIDLDLRTPVYDVHLLHFAVATLDLDMLKLIETKISLSSAGKTKLGHTLLHIACLPPNARAVQRHSEAIYQSIHETRDLHAQNDPHADLPPPFSPSTSFAEDFKPQTEVVKYLWASHMQDRGEQDIHGNTAIHYLVGYRNVNTALLTWLLEQNGTKSIWEGTTNRYGYTAQELFRSGEYARIVMGEGKPKPWFDRRWTRARKVRKQEIWRELLGDRTWRDL